MAADASLIVMDAAHKERAYRGLARHYAETGDAWLALHAQSAADIAAATVAVGQAPALVSLAGELVEEGLPLSGETGDAEGALIALREKVAACVPLHRRDTWRARLQDPSYLRTLPMARAQELRSMAAARLAGDTPVAFVSRRLSESRDGMSEAARLRVAGESWQAVEACYDSDLAAFEAWLVARSFEVGDEDLAQVEMRWALAVAVLETLTSLPEEFRAAAEIVRSRLVWVVGPADAPDLARYLQPLP